MAFKPSSRARGSAHGKGDYEDPDLVPMMNIMLLLLPVILSFISIIKFTEISYNPSPEIIVQGDPNDRSKGGGEGIKVSNKPQLQLLVNITEGGFQVSIQGGLPGDNEHYWNVPAIVNSKGKIEYDYEGLNNRLHLIRRDIIGKVEKQEITPDPVTGKSKYKVEFRFADAHQIRLSAQSQIPWKVITRILDVIRVYKYETFSDGAPMPLFQEPIFGQI